MIVDPTCMFIYVLLCGVFWGDSLSFGLQFKSYVSGTFDDWGKEKAWSYTSFSDMFLEILWYSDLRIFVFGYLVLMTWVLTETMIFTKLKNENFIVIFWMLQCDDLNSLHWWKKDIYLVKREKLKTEHKLKNKNTYAIYFLTSSQLSSTNHYRCFLSFKLRLFIFLVLVGRHLDWNTHNFVSSMITSLFLLRRLNRASASSRYIEQNDYASLAT